MIRSTALVVLLAAGLLSGCGFMLSTEARTARAADALAAGNYKEAVAQIQSALEKEPTNAAARLLFARIEYFVGDPQTAEQQLQKAIRDGADPAAAATLKYQLWSVLGRQEETLRTAPADAALKPAQREMAVVAALLDLGRSDEAATHLAGVSAAEDGNSELIQLRARLLWAQKRTDEAGTMLDALLKQHPEAAEAAVLRGRIALAVNDARAATRAFEQARLHAVQGLTIPQQMDVLGAMAALKLAAGDVAGAEVEVAAMQARAPGAFATHFYRARVLMSRNDHKAAVLQLEEALKLAPDAVPARLLLAAALDAGGSTEQAIATLTSLLELQPQNIAARKMLVAVYMRRNDVKSAQQTLLETPPELQNADEIEWMKGMLLASSGQTADALPLLERAAASGSLAARQRLDLAHAYIVAGRNDSALETLAGISPAEGGALRAQLILTALAGGRSRAAASDAILARVRAAPADSALLVAASDYFAVNGDAGNAKAMLTAALAINERNADALLGLSAIALRSGNQTESADLLRQLNKLDPAEERAYLGLARLALLQNDTKAAVQWLENAVRANPAAVESRLQLAALALQAGQTERARSFIDQALAAGTNRLPTLVRVAQLEIANGQTEWAAAHAGDYEKAGGNPDSVQILRGDIAYRQGKFADALDHYKRVGAAGGSTALVLKIHGARVSSGAQDPEQPLVGWLATHPTDDTVRMVLAQRLQVQGKTAAAIAQYETIAARAPSAVVLNNLAWLYLGAGDARAEATARRAYELQPGNPDVLDTYGWVLVQRDKAGTGLPLLEKAARSATRADPEAKYHYAVALAKVGQPGAAATELRALLAAPAGFASRARAEELLRTMK